MATSFKMCLKDSLPHFQIFEWTVYNYSKLPVDWIEKSKDFSVEPKSSWFVKFKKLNETVWLNLCKKDENNFKVTCDTLISNCDGEILYAYNESYENHKEHDLLFDSPPSDVLKNLPKDQAIFKIIINVVNMSSYVLGVPQNQQKNLSNDLKKLFYEGIKTDVTFSIRGEKLSAHKSILVARSEVFARMFQEGMTEEDNSVVDIEDIDLSTMKVLLSFMYSAELEECDFDTALEVYRAADKYAVADLKGSCAHVLTSKMTMENVIKILYVADMHCDTELKEMGFQFIAIHRKTNQREHHEKS